MFGMKPATNRTGLEDAFVKISFEDERLRSLKEGDSDAFNGWVDKGTCQSAHSLQT